MKTLTNLLFVLVLAVAVGSAQSGKIQSAAASQQGAEQNASPDQQNQEPTQSQEPSQNQEASQGQRTGSATVSTITGCLVQTGTGFALKTEKDTYPIETTQDLSQYANKQIRITGILERHTTVPAASSAGTPSTITDLRLRTIGSVVGECNQEQK